MGEPARLSLRTAPAADGRIVEWEIEGQPPAILRRQGWSAETLAVGDAVQVSGNPHRGGTPSLLLTKLEKAGRTLYDPQRLMIALGSSDPERAATATGLAGVWVTLLDMNSMLGFVNPAKRLSLTDAGHAAVAAYDERTMSPAINCVPFPAPGGMIAPDVKRIAVDERTVRIGGEFDSSERLVHLDVASHYGVDPSAQGHSIGRFEGKTLVIDTAAFAPHATGNGFNLRSSASKHVIETLALDEAGTGLVYTFELNDPEMLTAPFTGRVQWAYRPDLAFAPLACDLANARRFTEPR